MTQRSNETGDVTVVACAQSDLGKVRGNNEDCFVVGQLEGSAQPAPAGTVVTYNASSSPVLLVVSDGMGGANAGEVASALVVELLLREMGTVASGTLSRADFELGFRTAVERVNKEVWNAAREPGRRGMGATLTAMCIHGGEAHIAEVGDSRAYLVRGEKIRQITRDQSFVQVLIDSGALKPEEAAKNPMKNVVLQAMGQSPEVKVAIGRLDLRRGDRFLLCSDGLSNKVTDAEMRDVLLSKDAPEDICAELISLANERGGEDNITVVVANVKGAGLAEFVPVEPVTQTLHIVSDYRAAPAARREEPENLGDDDGAAGAKRNAHLPAEPFPKAPAIRADDAKAQSKLFLAIGIGVILALLVVFVLARL